MLLPAISDKQWTSNVAKNDHKLCESSLSSNKNDESANTDITKVSEEVNKESKIQVSKSRASQVVSAQLLFISVVNLVCSGIMSSLTKRELMFPQRTAPKYVFDVAQTGLILLNYLVQDIGFETY